MRLLLWIVTQQTIFFFRGMALFFREVTTIFRRLENSNNFQSIGNFFQILLLDCSGAIHPILGTFLLPIFRYPLPRPKMDFLIPAARSRSSRGPAKSAHFFSKQAKNSEHIQQFSEHRHKISEQKHRTSVVRHKFSDQTQQFSDLTQLFSENTHKFSEQI